MSGVASLYPTYELMKRIAEKKFIELIKHQGITLDPRYPASAELRFGFELSRFWKIPKEARRIPYFIETILNAIDPWTVAYVWKHLGSWTTRVKGERLNDDLQALIYKGIGITDDNADVLEFKISEEQQLITLIFNQLIFGWHVGDDLYVVPDHGRQMIKTDHHDVVHVSFRDEASTQRFVNAMRESKFPLPEEVPDETFKRPEWMK